MVTTESLAGSPTDATETGITVDQFAEIAATSHVPVELVAGRIVEMPGPNARHGLICGLIFSALMTWARKTSSGLPSVEAGIVVREDSDTLRFPDVLFVSADHLVNGTLPDRYLAKPPALCVEVISDSETWHNIQIKIEEYFAFGVSEVWIVDQQLKSLFAFSSPNQSKKYVGSDIVTSPTLPGFSVELSEFFFGC